MRLLVGSTALAANSCDVTRNIQAVFGARGNPVRYVHTLNVSGCLEGDTQTALAVAEAALQDALGTPYQDIALVTDLGLVTPVALVNSSSISGVRVSNLAFTNDYGGAEYATVRSFRFTAVAEYMADGDDLVLYTESVTVTGTGGPLVRYRQAINGPPVKQVVADRTPVRASQAGQAIGMLSWPKAALPLWPRFELGEQRVIKKDTPKPGANGYYEYPTNWAYQFEAEANFTGGNPLLPPKG